MKTLYLLGACALLSTTLFSCTADEFETAVEKTEVKKEITQPNETQATGEDEGPGDDPINVKPPKK
ncbi:hypothetical protein [Flavobacterium sp. YO12]|uniref:hypothetical protein n=1 Tax=unclassified Flavobacterium TaxID=196869 RepID=UPI00100A4A66|nr:hypothetical protein [Flavobacterium sp. YO12]RXM49221.1 hypothetical protein BOW55_02255 [Flavobacterium sp. YO12]